jgi:hypothetical protein
MQKMYEQVKYHTTDTWEKKAMNKLDTLFVACGEDDDPLPFAVMHSANLI